MNAGRRWTCILSAVIFSIAPVCAGIIFSAPALNDSDETVFCVRQDLPGTLSYSSLFYAKIKDGKAVSAPDVLTCYPESMHYLAESNSLRLQNRYGTALYSFTTGSLSWTEKVSSIPLDCGRLAPVSVSPDGSWLCYIERTDTATGKLVLEDFSTGQRVVLDDAAEFSYDHIPVKWSPESDMLLYEKDGFVCFCNPSVTMNNVSIEEKFRRIGKGSINSVCWADGSTLAYIDNDIVYRINSGELYTLGLYAGFVSTGTAAGRLPFVFNSRTDTFSVNGDFSSVVVIQSKCIISWLKTNESGYIYMETVSSSPFTGSDGTVVGFDVLWGKNDSPVLWARMTSLEDGRRSSSVYLLGSGRTRVLTAAAAGNPVVSPDGRKIAFSTGSAVYVYSLAPWGRIASLGGENVVSLTWKDSGTLCIGGADTVRVWNTGTDTAHVLFLSSAQRGFWAGDSLMAVAGSQPAVYRYDKTTGVWQQGSAVIPEKNMVQNGRYRIFTAGTRNSYYDNALYVRTLAGPAVTLPLFAESTVKTPVRRKAVLAFDAEDSAAGLAQILSVLDAYRVKGTFFLNGEFIRRYPAETRQIAAAGHECASLFFTTADLTAPGFTLDEDFIRRGLARTEDEFYACTGQELSLLWHAPGYRVRPEMIAAGTAAGYTYVDAPETVRDTVTLDESIQNGTGYLNAGELIDTYVRKLRTSDPGSVPVIPVTVGIARGIRSDYLYDRLDLLIDAILDSGFEIVTYDTVTK
jgi:peptidoglycan/xylan/chitin deacetylase (PgdA/CDA1 family)